MPPVCIWFKEVLTDETPTPATVPVQESVSESRTRGHELFGDILDVRDACLAEE
ncbi:hypothetical protein [Arthrobacter sp. DR-2P]|uniref:hypothetical protein n=1 Tax=unclassified Arthrobacter TaxID=235627 RepID=UPI0010E89FB2|nr:MULTISPECIES: hypothetical protein [unclassified Arthrobacter]VII98878.1 hypothetical protein [Arthrobacter sp. DR-2P]